MGLQIQPVSVPAKTAPTEANAVLHFESIAGWTVITQLLLMFVALAVGGMLIASFNCSRLLSNLSAMEYEQAALAKKARRWQLNQSESHRRDYLQQELRSDSGKLSGAAGMLTTTSFAALVATSVVGLALLAWFYKAYCNLGAFGEAGLTYSPLVALLLLFVPLYGIWVLYVLLEELWIRSPSRQPGTGRPATTVVQVWLMGICLSTVGGIVLPILVAQAGDSKSALLMVANVQIAVCFVIVVERLLLAWILGTIQRMQAERMALYK